MALTPSNMLPLGTKAPDFSLLDTVSGWSKSLKDIQSDKATVIMFICNHCPYVIHLTEAIAETAKEYQQKGVAFIAISSNDAQKYQTDSPENMQAFAIDEDFTFPYLYDETQEVAKAYDAACTPDFYVFDGDMKLAYRGRFDESRPNSGTPITGKDLKAALDAVLNGQSVTEKQYPSMGCNIKWKK